MSTIENKQNAVKRATGQTAPPFYIDVNLNRDEVFERIRVALPTPRDYQEHGSQHASGVIGELTQEGFWVARLENWTEHRQPDLRAIVEPFNGLTRITILLTLRKNPFRFFSLAMAIALALILTALLPFVGEEGKPGLSWFYRIVFGGSGLFIIYAMLESGFATGRVSFDMVAWTRGLFSDVQSTVDAPYAGAESD